MTQDKWLIPEKKDCLSSKVPHVENQVYRCTEITCMYSSHEDTEVGIDQDLNIDIPEEKKWEKVINTTFNMDKDIVFEVDATNTSPHGLKDVKAVELVLAVQSAIKQRQDLIEEWKSKTCMLSDMVEKLQREKLNLEKSNLSKETEIECLEQKLHELNKAYKGLMSECESLRKELEHSKVQNHQINEAYNSLVAEFREIKRQLIDAVRKEKDLEQKLSKRKEQNEETEETISRLESELKESRRNIKSLTCSLEETTKELSLVKQTLEEYKCTEAKLKQLKSRYQILKDKFGSLEIDYDKAVEEGAGLKEIISKLQLSIESLSSDKNELILAIKYINDEKECLAEKNERLMRDLNLAKKNFSEIQQKLYRVESDVESLAIRIEQLEKMNKHLEKELDSAKCENKQLSENLHNTYKECSTLSHALSEAQSQLDIQQQSLQKMECRIRTMINEKKDLELKLDNLEEEKKCIKIELCRRETQNTEFRSQNNELAVKLYSVTRELEDNVKEVSKLNEEIVCLRTSLTKEREKYDQSVAALQEKIRKKSHEWKEYVSKEIQRLRDKRRADIKKYLDLNKELENRLDYCQTHGKRVEDELNLRISELRKQLDCAKRKLDEVLDETEQNRNDIIENYKSEISKLSDQLNKQKIESEWLSAELESRIQSLVQKNLDDETTIHVMKKESARLKERILTHEEDLKKMCQAQMTLKNLIEVKNTMESELINTKNLLKLAEEMNTNLKEENTEFAQRLQKEEENAKNINKKVHKLKKIIGKKDAQIDVLNHTITQLKEHVSQITDENNILKCTVVELEEQHMKLSERVCGLNVELDNAKRALSEAGDDKKNLVHIIKEIEIEIKKLEKENSYLKTELETVKQNEFIQEKALENSHTHQVELRDRLLKAEVQANKSVQETKTLGSKLIRMSENVAKLESELSCLSDAYQKNEFQYKTKIDVLEKQIYKDKDEIKLLRSKLEESELHHAQLKKRLAESDKAFLNLSKIFDSLREVLCQVLNIEFIPIVNEDLSSNSITHDSSIAFTKTYEEICSDYAKQVKIFSVSILDLKQNERELLCKLNNIKRDFEKLSAVMTQLQNEYNQKVEKLYVSIKEKDEMIKNLEKQLIKIQLEAANADEAVAMTLKDKIEEQQKLINKLQDEKSVLQSEILCLARKVNEMESQMFDLADKIKAMQNKNGKLQLKNVSLQGDLEKLTLLLTEARDKEQQQIVQYKQMMAANRELMDKIRILKCELDSSHRRVEEYQTQTRREAVDTSTPKTFYHHEKELEHEVKVLTEKLKSSQHAETEARLAFNQMEKNLSLIKKQLTLAEEEKANLEGWVSHLQKLIAGGYIADSSLPRQLEKAKEDKKRLQQTVDSLKLNLNTLYEEKNHLKNTVDHLTKCNKNLETTISHFSDNRDNLEVEIEKIHKKVETMAQHVKQSETDVSRCSKDISCLMQKACEVSTQIKKDESQSDITIESDRRITTGILKCGPMTSADETNNSLSVTFDCQAYVSRTDSSGGCCVKPFSGCNNNATKSQACHDCKHMEIKHNNNSASNSIKKEKHTKKNHKESPQRDNAKGPSKTFV